MRNCLALLLFGLISLGFGTSVVSLAADPVQPAAEADVQDFVFLSEARPLLVRMHVRVDGKPLQAAWDDLMEYLFSYLDMNKDGVLSKEEAERAPSVDLILGGSVGRAFGGRRGPAEAGPSMEALDADKDGKVTLAELKGYYRKNSLAPVRFRVASTAPNPVMGAAAFLGGPRPEPSITAVSEAIFTLLDVNKDGKLTRDELAAAPAVLLRMDEDEDEIVTTRELVPDAEASANPFAGLMAMVRPTSQGSDAGSKTWVPIASPGDVPADFVRIMQQRYGADQPEKKLSRKDLGLDEATFARLDSNGDGVLDAQELAGFVKRDPDLELVYRLGTRAKAEARLEVAAGHKRSPLAGNLHIKDGLVQLDLGVTRIDLAGSEENSTDRFGGLVRDQFLVQFRQAEAGKGFIEEKQVQNNRLLRGLFKAMDRDGDGKLTEKEVVAYLDHSQELSKRARGACATLDLADQSRGLFDALDANRDGRLSVREMRGAAKLLEQFDRGGKGHLTRTDIPRSYRMTLHRGPAGTGNSGAASNFLDLYRAANRTEPEPPGRGPLWFRKMDRNRDGDVSHKEFLFSDELFRRIDTDGDGLISVEEAERYESQRNSQEKP